MVHCIWIYIKLWKVISSRIQWVKSLRKWCSEILWCGKRWQMLFVRHVDGRIVYYLYIFVVVVCFGTWLSFNGITLQEIEGIAAIGHKDLRFVYPSMFMRHDFVQLDLIRVAVSGYRGQKRQFSECCCRCARHISERLQKVYTRISWLRDFTRFSGKTSYRLVNRGPDVTKCNHPCFQLI